VVAGVLPEGKVAEIRRLQSEGRVVAMGRRRHQRCHRHWLRRMFGLAMAREPISRSNPATSRCWRADLMGIAHAIALSRKTGRFCAKICSGRWRITSLRSRRGLGISESVIASAAMAASSVSVVLNSLRLKRVSYL